MQPEGAGEEGVVEEGEAGGGAMVMQTVAKQKRALVSGMVLGKMIMMKLRGMTGMLMALIGTSGTVPKHVGSSM